MKRVPGFAPARDVAQAPPRPPAARRAAPSVESPEFKHALRHLTATALLSFEQFAFHVAGRWVEDDRLGRRHTRLVHDFSATGTGAKIDRSRQWTSHGFAELETTKVFRQFPQPRNPESGEFDQARPKLLGNCSQFWQLAKAKYAYLCIQAGLPIRNNRGKILYQDPKQTVAAQRGRAGQRRPEKARARPVPEPSEAEQWAALTPAQQRWVLQINLPGFTPPG